MSSQSISPFDVSILILGTADKPLPGRTVIQKLANLVTVLDRNIDLGFIPHYYGPYSRILASSLEELVNDGFIAEKHRLTQTGRQMYQYELTEDGQEIAHELKNKHPKKHELTRRVLTAADEYIGFNIQILSAAAKVHFLLRKRKKDQISYQEIINEATNLGWNECEPGRFWSKLLGEARPCQAEQILMRITTVLNPFGTLCTSLLNYLSVRLVS